MKADPKFSEGARMERKAFRDRLRRSLKDTLTPPAQAVLQEELDWVLSRQKRYDSKPGGLGKK
jgi:hypothetical protein